MDDKLKIIKQNVKKAGARPVILMIIVPLLFCVFAVAIVNAFLKKQYQMIHYEDTIRSSDLSADFMPYLDSVDILVEAAADGVEYINSIDGGDIAIHKYLEEISSNRDNIVVNDTDGIYGYINGKYNDGYNWIPYEGYDPTERIWYQKALEAKGKTIMVEPYIDARTGKMIVTVTRALENGVDVVAADIDLTTFQRLTEDIARESGDHEVMVVDIDGNVITCSFTEELGVNFATDPHPDRKTFYENWKKNEKNSFVTIFDGKRYLVSPQTIKFGWTAFTFTDVDALFTTLDNYAVFSVISIIIFAILLTLLILVIASRRVKADNDNESLSALSRIYISLHKIDLDNDTFEQIMCHNYKASTIIGEKRTEPGKVMTEIVNTVADQRSLQEMLEFVDLKTLDERIGQKDAIAMEFLGYEHLWHRARFIVVDRHQDGTLKTVLFASELIDDEKRYRDELQYLAETDQLTGITNRGSGEKKIKQLMALGKGGMFVLFDADRFKSINDTYGHEAGDLVLISIADKMKHSFREKDIIMRLGGDEFAAFVPGVCDKEEGEPIIQRFIEAIESINLTEIEGRKICISIGVAFYQEDDNYGFDELYKRADSCAYESKKTTGCAVTFYTMWYDKYPLLFLDK